MKNIVFVALILLGISLPVNAGLEVKDNQPSILFWLDFHISGDDGDDDEEGNNSFITFSLTDNGISGMIYSDGQMELNFDCDEIVFISIKLNDAEVNSVEFVPAEGDNSLTFDLDDFGKGAYEINVTMSDGSVQTATFEY